MTFITYKSCPFLFSRRDLLFHSILNILPRIILLPFSKSFISSVLTPSSALQNFLFFSPLGECLRGDHHTVCLGSKKKSYFHIFMPCLACYWKVWMRDFYRPKMSLYLPILMELWHFDFFRNRDQNTKIGRTLAKLDLSTLVFIYFCPGWTVRAGIKYSDTKRTTTTWWK